MHYYYQDTYQRKKNNDDKFQHEYNWVWSKQKVINMHEPEKWGTIQFTNKTSSENISFVKDKYMQIKQVAYSLFRQTKLGKLKALLKENTGNTRDINVKFSDKDYLKATFYKTNFGFEYKIKVPQSDRVFIINETGVLKRIE